MTERFFRSNRPGYPHPVCSELEIVVSEWRSVIAASLYVGGGVRLIKPLTLYMCMQTHYKHDEDRRTAPGVRGHGSVPLSHSGNVVTRTGLHTHPRSTGIHYNFIDNFKRRGPVIVEANRTGNNFCRRVGIKRGRGLCGNSYLTHCILVGSSSLTAICWTSPFVIIGVSGLFCHFYSIFEVKSC